MPIHPMESIKQELNQILTVLPEKSEIAYLEYPVYGNLGDILIMKGVEKFFADHKINVKCAYSFQGYKDIQLMKDTILVFQGGGNIGDLYPEPQRMREFYIERYTNHKIIILPQTIFFENPDALERTANIFSQHPDLHIFTRDPSSFKMAKEKLSDNVYLAPDMAHYLWPIRELNSPTLRNLYLLRTDLEKPCDNAIICKTKGDADYITDWPSVLSPWDKMMIGILVAFHFINKYKEILPARHLWDLFTRKLVNKTIQLFSQYSNVISTRMHGHLLACLMNKPNTLLTNMTHKNSEYFQKWT